MTIPNISNSTSALNSKTGSANTSKSTPSRAFNLPEEEKKTQSATSIFNVQDVVEISDVQEKDTKKGYDDLLGLNNVNAQKDEKAIEDQKNKWSKIDFKSVQDQIKQQMIDQLMVNEIKASGIKQQLSLPADWKRLNAADIFYPTSDEMDKVGAAKNPTDLSFLNPVEEASSSENDPNNYWNAENTSQRIVDFAMSFRGVTTNDGKDYADIMRQAVLSGFAQAKEKMGDIPGEAKNLFNDTLKLTMEKFDKIDAEMAQEKEPDIVATVAQATSVEAQQANNQNNAVATNRYKSTFQATAVPSYTEEA